MNKFIKKFTYTLAITMAFLATSCSDDIDSEITSLNTDRVFSPTGVTAKIVDQTGVRLTWNQNKSAESYQIEILQNGTTVKTVSDITNTDIPYTIKGLEGETEYTAQIKAIKTGIADSKYSTVTFKTDPEQIMKAVLADELKATEVTLRWTAGEAATEIVLTPGDIKHTVTAEEIAAGAATITGLNDETEYTAKLMKGTKTRGTAKFTTLVDLKGAVPVYPGDDMAAIIAAADVNATVVLVSKEGKNDFIFTDGETGAVKTLEITLTKDITIKGLYPTDRPTANIKFILDGCNNLKIQDMNLTSIEGGSVITVINSKDGNIDVTHCNVTRFGSLLVETENTQVGTINTFVVDNCVFHDMENGKRFVDYQKKKSFIAEFTLKNSTLYNCCSGSDFIRFDRHAIKNNIVNITNCTLYGIEATSKGLLYIRSNTAGNKEFTANITKCIFAHMSDKVYHSQDSKTDNLIFTSNYYFEASSLLKNPVSGAGKAFDVNGITLDPGFADVVNGNFTVSNPIIIDNEIGDPRWTIKQ